MSQLFENQNAVILVITGVLAVITLLRVASTGPGTAARREQLDTLALLALILMGVAGSGIRDRLHPGTAGYMLANVTLALLTGLAVYFLFRLFRAYKQGGSAPRKSNTSVMRPPDLGERPEREKKDQ